MITLMNWMQHSSDHLHARPVIFAALQSGHASFGYLQWAETAGFAVVGNMVGGVTLVTLLRLFQVPHKVMAERAKPAMGVPIGDRRREPPTEGP